MKVYGVHYIGDKKGSGFKSFKKAMAYARKMFKWIKPGETVTLYVMKMTKKEYKALERHKK